MRPPGDALTLNGDRACDPCGDAMCNEFESLQEKIDHLRGILAGLATD